MTSLQTKLGTTIVASAAATGVFLAGPAIAEASFGERTLSIGSQNSDVTQLQEELRKLGYFTFHTSTGYYGTVTEQAVKDFQRANSLTPDGIAGPKTFAQLTGGNAAAKQAASTQTASAKTSSSSSGSSSSSASSSSSSGSIGEISTSQLLRTGSRGDDVVKLQSYLKKAGFFDHHTATGYYGSVTERAVRNFQQARGLTVDGLAGRQTIAAMNKEIGSTSTSSGSSSTSSNSGSSGSSNSGSSSSGSTSSASGNLLSSNAVLREGSRGDNVRQLQTHLKELGHFNHREVTTYFGSITRDAVRSFQRSAGINVDGVAGPQTYRAIEQALNGSGSSSNNSGSSNSSNSSSSNSSSSGSSLLKEGNRGSSVTELQNMLRATGHFNQQPTGYFGSVTKRSVTAFQKEWGLVSDGLVSQATWDKLEEVSAVHMKHAETQTKSSTSGFNAINLIADASELVGVPYVWGGTTTSGFDCSGFIQYVFKKNGVNLPRTAAQQYNAGSSVSSPQVGDIVFFETYKSGPSHNGIYIGNNQFIHAGSSTGVTIANLNNSYWSQRYLGAKRVR